MNKGIENTHTIEDAGRIESEVKPQFDNAEQSDDSKSKFVSSIEKLQSKQGTNIESDSSKAVKEEDSFLDKFASFAEKHGAAITAVSTPLAAVMGTFNDVVSTITDTTSSYVTEASTVFSLDEALSTLGCVIKEAGNDTDAALKSPEDMKSDIDEEMESSILSNNSPKTEQPIE